MATDSKDLLEKFDPLSGGTDHAPSHTSTVEPDQDATPVTTLVDSPVTTPPNQDATPVTTLVDSPVTIPPNQQLPSDHVTVTTPPVPDPPYSSGAMTVLEQTTPLEPSTATPIRITPTIIPDSLSSVPILDDISNPVPAQPMLATPTPDHMTKATPTSSSPPKRKKKKKKHKKHSRKETSHVTSARLGTGHMTSEQINSDISEIDSFLESLKMGVTPISMATPTTKVRNEPGSNTDHITHHPYFPHLITLIDHH